MRIAAVGSAFPPHYYDQKTLFEALKTLLPDRGHGLLMAMGPGFCSELVLLRWPG